jgi:nitrogen fixation protein FixH
MSTVARAIGVLALVIASVGAAAAQTPAKKDMGKLDIMLMKPTAAKTGDNQFEVMVKDAKGKPVTKADVSLLFVMPAMPAMKMPEMKNTVKLMPMKDGMYAGQGNVMMAGTWNVTIDVMQNGKSVGQKKVTVTAK